MPGKRPNATRTRGKPAKKAFALLDPGEAAQVLHALLKRHSNLAREAEEIARTMLTEIDAEAIAEDVESALLALDQDDVVARSGGQRYGYVDPAEVAGELAEAALEPFLERMRRLMTLGFEATAAVVCQGIVLGLYQCRGKSCDEVVGWAGEAFPADSAESAVATLVRESAAQSRHQLRLPKAFLLQVPEWTDILRRAGLPLAPRRRHSVAVAKGSAQKSKRAPT